jgi:hypothetical protein
LEPAQLGRRGGGSRAGGAWEGGWAGWLVSFLAAAAVFAGVYVLVHKTLPGAKAQRTWSAAESAEVPTDFLFLMFPKDDKVPIYDAPDGRPVGILQRGLGNIYGEVRDAKWVRVPAGDQAEGAEGGKGDKAATVRASDLRYLSPAVAGTMQPLKEGEPRPPNYVANFAAAYRARKPDEYRAATYLVHMSCPADLEKEAAGRTDMAGGRFLTLRLQDGGNRRDFHAFATAERAIPLAIDQLYEGSKFTSSITRWTISGFVALLAAVAAWLSVLAMWRSRGPGRPLPLASTATPSSPPAEGREPS